MASELVGFNSPTKEWPCTPALEVCSLNHWATREVPCLHFWRIVFLDMRLLIDSVGCFVFFFPQHFGYINQLPLKFLMRNLMGIPVCYGLLLLLLSRFSLSLCSEILNMIPWWASSWVFVVMSVIKVEKFSAILQLPLCPFLSLFAFWDSDNEYFGPLDSVYFSSSVFLCWFFFLPAQIHFWNPLVYSAFQLLYFSDTEFPFGSFLCFLSAEIFILFDYYFLVSVLIFL